MFLAGGALVERWRNRRASRHRLDRYGWAIALPILGAILRAALNPVLATELPYILFFPGVIVSAWRGGLGPGLVATGVSMGLVHYLFIPPLRSLGVSATADLVGQILFGAIGLTFSALNETLHRSRRALHVALEKEVSEAVETRRRWEHVFENASWGMSLATPESRIIQVNPAFAAMHGTTVEEWTGRPIVDMFADESKGELPSLTRLLHERGQIVYESTHVRKDGTRFPVLAEVTAFKDERGRVLFHAAAYRDISERKRAEERLAESERQFRELVENLPELAWSARPDGHVDFYNQRWYEFTGTTPEQMEGWGWQSVHHPRELPRVMAMWKHALEAGEAAEMEYPLRRKDGVYRQFLTRIRPLRDSRGEIVRWFGTNTDITSLREADQRVQALSAASSVFIRAKLDVETIFQTLVDTVCPTVSDSSAVLALNDAGDALSVAAWRHAGVPDPSLPPSLASTKIERDEGLAGRVLTSGEPVFLPSLSPEEVRAAIKPQFWSLLDQFPVASLIVTPLRASSGVLGVLYAARRPERPSFVDADKLLVQELGDRASLAIESARSWEEAQKAIRLRDDFLSIASHELRTPLTALQLQVHGMGRLLETGRAGAADARLARQVQVASQQTDRLGRLVDRLLDVSRISLGKLMLEREDTDLVVLARAVIERLSGQAAAARCPLVLAGEAAVAGCWDRLRIEQVITNLVENAIKYGAGAPVEITVEARGGWARLSVHDSGIGIRHEDLDRIFRRFERAVSSRHYGGLGLGLYISSQIAEAHGGRIGARSEPGSGTTFVLDLPRKPDDA